MVGMIFILPIRYLISSPIVQRQLVINFIIQPLRVLLRRRFGLDTCHRQISTGKDFEHYQF